MGDYSKPVERMRETVKGWQWEAEKLRREAKDLETRAATIYDRSIKLDLLADKIEKAMPADAASQIGEQP